MPKRPVSDRTAISSRGLCLMCRAVLAAAAVPVLLGQAPPPASPPKPVAKPAPGGAVLTLGVIGGGQLRDWFQSVETRSAAFADNSGRFMIGPTLQFHWTRVAVQVDAMRRGFGARSSGSLLGVGFSAASTGSAWEFPAQVKRKFYVTNSFRPFLGGGIAIRYMSQQATVASTADQNNREEMKERTVTFGFPISAGLEFKAMRFRFAPELRYTLWTADKSYTPIRTSGLYDALHNQVALLVAFTF